MTDALLYTFADQRSEIVFNLGEKLNVFSDELVGAIHTAIDQAMRDQARYIVFRANGKAFSAGLDLSDIENLSDGDILHRLVRIELLLQRIRHAKCATVALVHGNCYGAAADLVLACRYRIASHDASFLMPGIRFGIVLGTRRLRDTVGENNASKLLDRDYPFNAQEALDCGFATALADPSDWPSAIDKATHALLQLSAEAYAERESALIPDTRDHDMAALVRSVTSGSDSNSIQQRIIEFVASLQARKASTKSRQKTG